MLGARERRLEREGEGGGTVCCCGLPHGGAAEQLYFQTTPSSGKLTLLTFNDCVLIVPEQACMSSQAREIIKQIILITPSSSTVTLKNKYSFPS